MKTDYALERSQQTSQSQVSIDATVAPVPIPRHTRLYRLPCPRCGTYYFEDEPTCPLCESRMNRLRNAASSVRRGRLLRLPCPRCGAYYFSDEPECPVCESRRMKPRPPTSM